MGKPHFAGVTEAFLVEPGFLEGNFCGWCRCPEACRLHPGGCLAPHIPRGTFALDFTLSPQPSTATGQPQLPRALQTLGKEGTVQQLPAITVLLLLLPLPQLLDAALWMNPGNSQKLEDEESQAPASQDWVLLGDLIVDTAGDQEVPFPTLRHIAQYWKGVIFIPKAPAKGA